MSAGEEQPEGPAAPGGAPAGLGLPGVGLPGVGLPGVGPRDSTRTAASPPAEAFSPVPPEEPFPEIPGYCVLRKLGQGGQGAVYLAESQDGLRKQTAIKLFPKEAKASYTRELEAWGRVEEIRREHNTPHLVEGYTAGTTPDGQTYVVMAYFEKASLADRLAIEGPLPASTGVRYARHVLAALDLLHTHGLFHRDVKPQNLLLGSDGLVRLADYGLSKALGTSVTGSCTPAFAAPEQLAGEPGADGVKIDIYGVGATLFALLTGRPPVPGRPDVFLLEKLKVPRPVQAVLLRSLNPDAMVRFASAADFSRALAQADPHSSGRLLAPAADLAPGRWAGDELASPTVASAGSGVLDSPFVRTPDVSLDAVTKGSVAGGSATQRRTARAKALIGAAALLACGAFVAEGIRGQNGSLGFLIGNDHVAGTDSSSEIGRASPRPPSPGPAEPALVVEPRASALTLEGVRELGSSDRGLVLVQAASALVPRPGAVALVRGPVAHAVPWEGESVVVARPTGAVDLVDATGSRSLDPAREASPRGARPRALAGHAGSHRIAIARHSGSVVLETLSGAQVVARTPLPGSGGGLVTALAFDESGERLALASLGADGVGHLAVFRCGREPTLEHLWDDQGPLAVAWVGTATLAVGGLHGEVATVDVASGRRTRSFPAFEDEVASLARVPGTDLLVALGDDRKLETAPFPGSIAVRDAAGTQLFFAVHPRPRILAWTLASLVGAADSIPNAVIDASSLDPALLR